jgi:hypothetical protein
MSMFPNSPRLLKGGIVLLDPDSSAVLRIMGLQPQVGTNQGLIFKAMVNCWGNYRSSELGRAWRSSNRMQSAGIFPKRAEPAWSARYRVQNPLSCLYPQREVAFISPVRVIAKGPYRLDC